VGTVLADDPELTVRHTCGKSPLRIILDTNLSLPPDSRVLREGCLILTGSGDTEKKQSLERAGAKICVVPRAEGTRGRVDLEAAVREIARRNVQSLMVEGGPKVLSAFIEAQLCDSLALFTSSAVMGEGPGLGSGIHFDSMRDAVRLRETRTRRAGNDMYVEGIFQCSPAL
jgi:diaminohydroxyphosphoribosylaminopyrimidine deaminase/5-amino-6-(5-phosphoribosylamino)uracil reductase